MWWHGRENSGGSWLLEDKMVIFSAEWEIVVAHGRLPSPALPTEFSIASLVPER